MKFNEKLVQKIKKEDRPLAEVILFFIERGYNFYHFFPKATEGEMIMTENLYEDTQRIVGKLLESEVLIANYPEGSNLRLSPTEALYVSEQHTLDFDVNKLRHLFPVGRKSDKITVNNMLKEFFKEHTEYSMDDVVEAAKLYLNNCRLQEITIRYCNNFIKDDEGVSLLLQWLEEIESKGNKTISNEFI